MSLKQWKIKFKLRIGSREQGAGMAQWLSICLPCRSPTNVVRVQFLDLASNVGWVCCWFSSLLQEVFFLRVLRFSPLLKNQHFQIPIDSEKPERDKPIKYVFIYLFIKLDNNTHTWTVLEQKWKVYPVSRFLFATFFTLWNKFSTYNGRVQGPLPLPRIYPFTPLSLGMQWDSWLNPNIKIQLDIKVQRSETTKMNKHHCLICFCLLSFFSFELPWHFGWLSVIWGVAALWVITSHLSCCGTFCISWFIFIPC